MHAQVARVLWGAIKLEKFTAEELAAEARVEVHFALKTLAENSALFCKVPTHANEAARITQWRVASEEALRSAIGDYLPSTLAENYPLTNQAALPIDRPLLAAEEAFARIRRETTTEQMLKGIRLIQNDLNLFLKYAHLSNRRGVPVDKKSFVRAAKVAGRAITLQEARGADGVGIEAASWKTIRDGLICYEVPIKERHVPIGLLSSLFNIRFNALPSVWRENYPLAFVCFCAVALICVAPTRNPEFVPIKDMSVSMQLPGSKGEPALVFLTKSRYFDTAREAKHNISDEQSIADAFYLLGERNNDVFALEQALLNYRNILDVPENNSDKYTNSYAVALNKIGNTQLRIGVYKKDKDLLAKSATTFDAALAKIARENSPNLWLELMNNKGAALLASGSASGNLKDLEGAIDVLDSLQKSQTLEITARVIILNNLGNAMLELADREKRPSELLRALEILQMANNDISHRPDTAAWAITRANLGNAFLESYKAKRGIEAKKDIADLSGALSAFQSAYIYFAYDREFESDSINKRLRAALDNVSTISKTAYAVDDNCLNSATSC